MPMEPETEKTDYFATDVASDQLAHWTTQFAQQRQLRRIRKGLHVLIVEDQPFSRRLLQEFFWSMCTVDAAGAANDAMAMYIGNAPNLAFLDIDLPDQSGHRLAELIKQIDPDAFVVMVTANNTSQDVERARANHIDGYIIKPFSKLKIMTCLDKYRALHPQSASARGRLS